MSRIWHASRHARFGSQGVVRLVAGLPLFVALAVSAAGLPQAVQDQLTRAAIPESAASIWVAPVTGGTPTLELNAERAMNPASTMKLVTTYVALQALGPAFTWKTRVYLRGVLDKGVLNGDLTIKGGGDPKLVIENLWLLLSAVRARGVRDIAGDILLDRSLFEPVGVDPGQFDAEPLRPYNVAPDALLFNFKTITLHFMPDPVTRVVRVYSVPQLAGQEIVAPRYGDGPCTDLRSHLGADFSSPERVRFAGSYPGACGEKELSVSVYSHADYDGALVRELWTELGGHLSGSVREARVAADAGLFYEYQSPPLADVVRDINKYSNNVMARELFLSLSAELRRPPASLAQSGDVVAQVLADSGLSMPELVLENGSGLSRSERISAASMGHLLVQAFASPVMPEFISSLPMVGIDGTMRHRLSTTVVAGQAHIKTGTLADCRAIAGYVLAASGRRYAVVAFLNHPNAPAAQAVHDTLLQWIYEHG